jgi:hypothetical protein
MLQWMSMFGSSGVQINPFMSSMSSNPDPQQMLEMFMMQQMMAAAMMQQHGSGSLSTPPQQAINSDNKIKTEQKPSALQQKQRNFVKPTPSIAHTQSVKLEKIKTKEQPLDLSTKADVKPTIESVIVKSTQNMHKNKTNKYK